MDDVRFLARLRFCLRHFDRANAIALSEEIHAAEENGYELKRGEDRAWLNLSYRINEIGMGGVSNDQEKDV